MKKNCLKLPTFGFLTIKKKKKMLIAFFMNTPYALSFVYLKTLSALDIFFSGTVLFPWTPYTLYTLRGDSRTAGCVLICNYQQHLRDGALRPNYFLHLV